MEDPWSQVCGPFRDYGMSQKVIQPLITDLNEWFCSALVCYNTVIIGVWENLSFVFLQLFLSFDPNFI